MKFRLLYLATIALLFCACSKDDDQGTTVPTSTTLLSVKVNETFIGTGNPEAYIFASKADGTLLDFQQITNDTTIILKTEESDITDFTATVVVNRSNDPNAPKPYLNSIPEVPAESQWYLNGPNPNVMPLRTATLIIEGTGATADWPETASSAAGVDILQPNNGNLQASFTLRQDFLTLPTLVIYKSLLDNQVRYFYDEAMPTDIPFYVQHTDLPTIPSPTIINFGETGTTYYAVVGIVTTPDNRKFSLPISDDFDIPANETEQYIPPGLFDEYYTFCGGSLPNGQHLFGSSYYTDAVETNFTYPNFDFQVDATATGFNFSTSDDLSEFLVHYKIGPEVNWVVNSPKKDNVSFTIPTLPTELITAFSMLAQPLDYVDSHGYRYDPPRTTTQFYGNLYLESNIPVTAQPYTRLDVITHN
jgi:hypothetical protein